MKILHTSDWHLGARLGGHDLSPALLAQVERLLAVCQEREVEVLLVAGDVFEKKYGLSEITKRLAQMLRPHVQRGLHVVLVPGNHDDREHFRMMRALLSLTHDEPSGSAGASPLAARVKIVEGAEVFSLQGVHFGVLPYPSRELLLANRPESVGDERWIQSSAACADVVRAWGHRLKERAARAGEPCVFVAHVTIAGVETPSGHEINYNEDIRLGRDDLPQGVAYTALGHIHQKQKIPCPEPCYYAGSIERLDMGEWRDDKFALLVDVPPVGHAQVEEIPLPATPFAKLKVASSELDGLAQSRPEVAHAFAHIEIECQPGDDKVSLQRRVREMCPRALDVQLTGAGSLTPAAILTRPRDVRATALDFVREKFEDDPDLPALEAATRSLLAEVAGDAEPTSLQVLAEALEPARSPVQVLAE